MTSFQVYFQIGFEHIVALDGIDHILFIAVLCAIYPLKAWKKILILATAFTIGHSITLALTALDYLNFPKYWIELLIPFTILITAIANFFEKKESDNNLKINWTRYFFAIFFGLIHGLAYAKDLKSLMALSGADNFDLIQNLFAFNLGIELGQIVIILIVLLFSHLFNLIFVNSLKSNPSLWNYSLSGISGFLAVIILIFKFF